MYNVQEVLDRYSEEDRKTIVDTMQWFAIFNIIPAPQTQEDFIAFCDECLKNDKKCKEEEKRKQEYKEKKKQEKEAMLKEKAKKYGYGEDIMAYKKDLAKAKKVAHNIEKITKLQNYNNKNISIYKKLA